MRVIALLRGLFTQTLESVIAWRTQSAGHVFPEPMTLGGNSTSAERTSHQPQPASTVRSQKSEPALQTIQVQKRGSVNKTAQQQQDQQLIQAGSKSQTLAPPTHQPVKQEQSPLKKVAKLTTLDQLQKQDKALAQTLTVSQSGESGKSRIPASKTHQPAKPASKPAKNPASKTKAASRRTRGKAHAQTLTVNPSGDSGN